MDGSWEVLNRDGHTHTLTLSRSHTQDLDELHAAFVEPLLGRIKEYTSHRKFFDAPKSVIDQRCLHGPLPVYFAHSLFKECVIWLMGPSDYARRPHQ
eukprot:1161500-Pelagomonas_calceolata.AAC.8